MHNYGTRAANHYRSYSYRTYLQSFTKVPKSGTLSQYQLLLHLVFFFFTFKFLSIISWIEQAALTHFLFINDSRGGLCYKPSGFFRSPRHCCKFYHSFSFYLNKANKWTWWKQGIQCVRVMETKNEMEKRCYRCITWRGRTLPCPWWGVLQNKAFTALLNWGILITYGIGFTRELSINNVPAKQVKCEGYDLKVVSVV